MARIIFNGPEAVLRLPSLGVDIPAGGELDVPAEVAAQLLAWPAVDVDVYADEPVERPDAVLPPKVGFGSGRAAWAEYAVAIGVPIEDRWSRDRIIAACDQALAEPKAEGTGPLAEAEYFIESPGPKGENVPPYYPNVRPPVR